MRYQLLLMWPDGDGVAVQSDDVYGLHRIAEVACEMRGAKAVLSSTTVDTKHKYYAEGGYWQLMQNAPPIGRSSK